LPGEVDEPLEPDPRPAASALVALSDELADAVRAVPAPGKSNATAEGAARRDGIRPRGPPVLAAAAAAAAAERFSLAPPVEKEAPDPSETEGELTPTLQLVTAVAPELIVG